MEFAILIPVAFAIWAGAVAASKKNNPFVYGLLGLLLPVIGLVIAYVARPAKTKPVYEPFIRSKAAATRKNPPADRV